MSSAIDSASTSPLLLKPVSLYQPCDTLHVIRVIGHAIIAVDQTCRGNQGVVISDQLAGTM
jgi:hypothetical protein